MSDRIDKILAGIDEALEDMPPVVCWRCNERMGEPSTCTECKKEIDGYESPPKGMTRIPWNDGNLEPFSSIAKNLWVHSRNFATNVADLVREWVPRIQRG